MLDTIFTLLKNAIVIQTMKNITPQRQENIDPSIAPFDIYETNDGYVAIGVGNDRLFKIFCELLEREDLLDNPLYATNDLRSQNYRPELKNITGQWCKGKSKLDVEKMGDEIGIPCGPILDMKEAIEYPQIQAREMMVRQKHPAIGNMYFQGCPVKLSRTLGKVETPAPLLCEYNDEFYKNVLGFSEEKYKYLKDKDII